jgi:hypothetical protein
MRTYISGNITCHTLSLPLWYNCPYHQRALTLHWQLSGSSQLMIASQITVAQTVKHMTCIRETSTSNLTRNIYFFIWILRGFAQSLTPGKCLDIIWNKTMISSSQNLSNLLFNMNQQIEVILSEPLTLPLNMRPHYSCSCWCSSGLCLSGDSSGFYLCS